MAYTRTRLTTVYSSASDYASPTVNASYEITGTQTKKQHQVVTAAATATTTNVITLTGLFTTATAVLVKNLSATLSVTMTFSSASQASKVVIPAGDWIKISTVNVATALYFIEVTGIATVEVTVYGT